VIDQITSLYFKMTEKEVKKQMFKTFLPKLVCSYCKAVPGFEDSEKERYKCGMKGHNLCKECSKSFGNDICRVCGLEQGSKVSKLPCDITFTLLETLPFVACKNYKNGCQEIFEQKNEEHSGRCEHREIFCPWEDCRKLMPFKCLTDHIAETHKSYLEKVSFDGVVKISRPKVERIYFIPTLLTSTKNDYEQFFFCSARKTDGSLYCVVYFFGPSNEVQNYKYSITLTGPKEEITYVGTPVELEKNIGDIRDNHESFEINETMYLRLLNKENQLDYTLKVTNLKEEAKDENDDSGLSSEEQN